SGTTYAYQLCGQAQPGGAWACVGPQNAITEAQQFTTLPSCTQTLSPGADVGSAVENAPQGAVICLSPGTYTSPGTNGSFGSIASPSATVAAPVTLTT